MGDVTFVIPKTAYSSLTSFGMGSDQFALKLSLSRLAGARANSSRELFVNVVHDDTGRTKRDHRPKMLQYSDVSSQRTDEHGFIHYANPSGEFIEKQDERGQWFIMQCSRLRTSAATSRDICSREAWYSETIKLAYTFPQSYLSKALDIEAALFRTVNTLKAK